MPEPYNRTQLRALRATLDERWPKLPSGEAERFFPRYREGRSPYSRVRGHAIRAQLDAIVALALHMGLRRGEIFGLTVDDAHYYNRDAVVRGNDGTLNDNAREVPFTEAARDALYEWLTCRSFLRAEHKALWLNLHGGASAHLPMSEHTFNRVLQTYLGDWNLQRLRATCAAAWVRSGMPLEHLRELLGLSRIEDTLPYARLIRGSLDGSMAKYDSLFRELVQPEQVAA